tara:strand:- start:144 stop:440 length:297 start_codon:yes stop_codon:yes gene_type:complete
MATNNIEKQSFGEAGAAYVKDAAATATGQFCAITSLDDATYLSAITWPEMNKHTDGSAIGYTATIADSAATIPKGVTIYGQITSFTLGAGRVIAYNAA